MALSDLINTLNTAMGNSNTAVANATTRKVASASLADNANALNGQTSTQLVAAANTATNAHATNQGNPHGTTAAELGAYPSTTIDSMIAALIPAGILPISTFGNVNGSAPAVTVSVNNSAIPPVVSVTFAAGIPAIMAGQSLATPAQTVQFGINQAVNVYLQLVGGVPSYTYSTTSQPETSTLMYLGTVTTNSSGVVTGNTIGHVVRLDNYRLSTTAQGAAIPVSNGTPDQTGQHLAWT
jgi:hypothetical protein